MNQDIDVAKIKEMLDHVHLNKNPQLDRNKAIFDMLAEKVQEAYNAGFSDGFTEGANMPPRPTCSHPQYPFYKVTWVRPTIANSQPYIVGDIPRHQVEGDMEYGCSCCKGNCNHHE